jgi:mRNA interferase MazF
MTPCAKRSKRSRGTILVLTRDRAVPVLRTVLVAPVTRSMRGVPTEVALGDAEGLRYQCAATIDNLKSVPKAVFTRQLGSLGVERRPEVCAAMRAAIDC